MQKYKIIKITQAQNVKMFQKVFTLKKSNSGKKTSLESQIYTHTHTLGFGSISLLTLTAKRKLPH